MIYKFKSKASGDLFMMGPAGEQVLGLIGKSADARGIIEAGALPAAMAALERAIAAEDTARASPRGDDEPEAAVGGAITLRQRAWPMLEMMKRAHAENADIVWGV